MNLASRINSGGVLIFSIIFLLLLSTVVLWSISPILYPWYFLYILVAIILYLVFSSIDFNIFTIFSKHLYVISIILLLLPLIIGQVTRGTIRWIPLGPVSIQPSEILRPFLLLYFATFLTHTKLNVKRLLTSFIIIGLPFFLIAIQPSLGVAILTAAGFFGALLASNIDKKYIAIGIIIALLLVPVFWLFLADYQKERVTTFLNPTSDRLGAGYNSVQSMIAVGSGKLLGRGLGKGVQTQLAFLPEKHTDFIFAATAEELGFVGAMLLLTGLFLVLMSLIHIVENSYNATARAYVSAVFFVMLIEISIHIGMNLGVFPITGIPLPFVSAGGSSLIGSTLAMAIAVAARKREIG